MIAYLSRNYSPIRRLRGRKMRLDGLAIVSFPKSGRTWLRFMLDQLGISPRFTHENADRRASLDYVRENIRLSTYRRVIFLYRNPLDTVVSFYNHAKYVTDWPYAPDNVPDTLSEFLRHPTMGIGYILEFNAAWLAAADRFDEFLPVSYEELRAEPLDGLRRIVDFCKVVRVSDRAIQRAVDAGKFDRMKQLEEAGKLAELYPGKFAGRDADPRGRKVRSGRVGNYRSSMSDEDVRYCIEEARRVGWPIEKLLAADDPLLPSRS